MIINENLKLFNNDKIIQIFMGIGEDVPSPIPFDYPEKHIITKLKKSKNPFILTEEIPSIFFHSLIFNENYYNLFYYFKKKDKHDFSKNNVNYKKKDIYNNKFKILKNFVNTNFDKFKFKVKYENLINVSFSSIIFNLVLSLINLSQIDFNLIILNYIDENKFNKVLKNFNSILKIPEVKLPFINFNILNQQKKHIIFSIINENYLNSLEILIKNIDPAFIKNELSFFPELKTLKINIKERKIETFLFTIKQYFKFVSINNLSVKKSSIRISKNIKKNFYILDKSIKNSFNNSFKIFDQFYKIEKINVSDIVVFGSSHDLTKLQSLKKYEDILNNDFLIISISSAVDELLKYSINPDFIFNFDPNFFNLFTFSKFNLKNSNIFISLSSYFSILKRNIKLNNRLFLLKDDLFKKEMNKISYISKEIKYFLSQLPSITIFSSSINTIIYYLLSLNNKINLYLIGSDYNYNSDITHINSYPLYKYVIYNSSYISTLLNWETRLKIYGKEKLKIYKTELKLFDIQILKFPDLKERLFIYSKNNNNKKNKKDKFIFSKVLFQNQE